MLTLDLVRHAQAVENSPDGRDESRWLSAVGRRQAWSIGEALCRQGALPDLILTSPLVRAVQTAEGLAAGMGYSGPVDVCPALAPEGTLPTLIKALAWYGVAHALVVGHEPEIGLWASRLEGLYPPRPLGRGELVRLSFDGDAGPGRGRRLWQFAAPRHL